MNKEQRPRFDGFLPPNSSTTYCPNQFFDVVVRRASRSAVRLVAYLIRRTLGWSDSSGRPQTPCAVVSWRQLKKHAGIGHSSVASALNECIRARYIRCLHPGRPDRMGEAATSACYELRWDEGDAYVTDPDRFQGFYAGNGNLTHIPNEFFDLLVPREPLSVIRMVGAIIRHTIGFQTRFGFRRQEVRMSHAALQRYTNLSHEAVRLALAQALARNYVVCFEPGAFDTNAGKESRPATYGIRWRDNWNGQPSRPAPVTTEPLTRLHQPARNRPFRNVVRVHSDNLHGNRSETLYGKKTTVNNTYKQQHRRARTASMLQGATSDTDAAAGCVSTDASHSPPHAFARLIAVGFDTPVARQLAKQFPFNRIERQCDWLERRCPNRNRLGMLRKAIEEDWPEPPACGPDGGPPAACAGAYYERLGSQGRLRPRRPSAEDLAQASLLLQRLADDGHDVSNPTEWGTQLARIALRTTPDGAKAATSFAAAVLVHSDGLLDAAGQRRDASRRRDHAQARRKHHAEHRSAYLAYLRAREAVLQNEDRPAYERFRDAELRQRENLSSGFVARTGLTDRMLAAFDHEEEHLVRFERHFTCDRQHPVPDFWEWDRTLNPHPFRYPAPVFEASPAVRMPSPPTAAKSSPIGLD